VGEAGELHSDKGLEYRSVRKLGFANAVGGLGSFSEEIGGACKDLDGMNWG